MGRATQRSIEILELVAQKKGAWSHAEIARQLGIPKSTLTGLLRDLVRQQYLELDGDAFYSIGPRVLILSRAYLGRMDVVSRSKDILARLSESADEAASVAVRQGSEIVVVAQEVPTRPLVAAMAVGDRAPLVATATGKSILAFMDPEAVAEIVAREGGAPSTAKRRGTTDLMAELARIRAGSLATNDEEWMEDISAIALPILTPEGAIASIAVAAPTIRMTKAWLTSVEPRLRAAAADLALRMGGSVDHLAS